MGTGMRRPFKDAPEALRCKAMMNWFSKVGKRVVNDAVRCGRRHVDGIYCRQHRKMADRALAAARAVLSKEPAKKSPEALVRGIVQAAIEMAVLRHDLCFEDGPPIDCAQCAELVRDSFNALHGIDTCLEDPAPEVAAMYAVLGVKMPSRERIAEVNR